MWIILQLTQKKCVIEILKESAILLFQRVGALTEKAQSLLDLSLCLRRDNKAAKPQVAKWYETYQYIFSTMCLIFPIFFIQNCPELKKSSYYDFSTYCCVQVTLQPSQYRCWSPTVTSLKRGWGQWNLVSLWPRSINQNSLLVLSLKWHFHFLERASTCLFSLLPTLLFYSLHSLDR